MRPMQKGSLIGTVTGSFGGSILAAMLFPNGVVRCLTVLGSVIGCGLVGSLIGWQIERYRT